MKPSLPNSEKVFLIIIAIVSFSYILQWGDQTIVQILRILLDVSFTQTTFLTPLIGVLALIGSALLLFGALFRWIGRSSFLSFFILGSAFFIFTSLFQMADTILLVKQTNDPVTQKVLEETASILGSDVLHVILWVGFILLISHRYKNEKAPLEEKEISLPPSSEK